MKALKGAETLPMCVGAPEHHGVGRVDLGSADLGLGDGNQGGPRPGNAFGAAGERLGQNPGVTIAGMIDDRDTREIVLGLRHGRSFRCLIRNLRGGL